MEKQITTAQQKSKSFELVQGSNYKIIDSFQQEYVVDFAQFQRISHALFKENAEMVTINKDIVGTKFIYKITPTHEKTLEQIRLQEIVAREIQVLKEELSVLEKGMMSWRSQYLDENEPEYKWKFSPRRQYFEMIQGLAKRYWKEHPSESKRVDEITANIEALEHGQKSK